MQVTLDIPINRLINIINTLPVDQIAKIKSEINHNSQKLRTKKEKTDFQKFLLKGPVMTDEQYNQFLENRKRFNQWRIK